MKIQSKSTKERILENHLRYFKTYQVGVKNLEQQLEYIMPSLVTNYSAEAGGGSFFSISNTTEKFALDRIEGKRALDLREEIERYKLITSCIQNALEDLKEKERDFVKYRYFDCLSIQEVKSKMGYSEDKSIFRIRRHVLDKLLISLSNLFSI
jgi:DNA-directed RNA polymerase specialized sigma subunit